MELSREYVYGPAHVDELLVQYTGLERELPWWLIGDSFDGEGGGGNVTTVCTPGVPDGSGGVYESLVAFQCVYDAHGVVVAASRNLAHPPLHVGFKGLFAERLDGGVSETMLGDDRPRLVPGGTVIYHNRNRTLHAGLGRFLQCDPNATGLLTQPVLAYGGHGLGLSPSGASLDALVGDGVNLYQYARGNTGRWGDPSGLMIGTMVSMAAGVMIPTPTDFITGAYKQLINTYANNLEFDLDWAMDWSLPDDWSTRNDSKWVTLALMRGIKDSFDITVLYYDINVNPLDLLPAVSAASGTNGGNPQRHPSAILVDQNGVTIRHYYRSNDHSPAHLHVMSNGHKPTRVGPNGRPLEPAYDRMLTAKEMAVFKANRTHINRGIKMIQRFLRTLPGDPPRRRRP